MSGAGEILGGVLERIEHRAADPTPAVEPRPGMWARDRRAHPEQDDSTVPQGPVVACWEQADAETGEMRWRIVYLPTVNNAFVQVKGQIPRREVWADEMELGPESLDKVAAMLGRQIGRWANTSRARLTRHAEDLVLDCGRIVEQHRSAS